jgi:hypothetical protein
MKVHLPYCDMHVRLTPSNNFILFTYTYFDV